MKRIRHSPEQIIRKLREADAELAKGTAIPEICKALGIAENTYYRWRNQFGGIKADEMKRLKELEKENARLKALVAELSLDKGDPQGGRPGKLVSPARRREAVARAMTAFRISERRAVPSPGRAPVEPAVRREPNENERRSCCCGSGRWPGRTPATATDASGRCSCGRAGRSTSSGCTGSGVVRG